MPQDSLCKQGVIQLLYQEHQAWVACLDQQIVQILAQEKQLAMRYTSYKLAPEWTWGLQVNNLFDKQCASAGRLGLNVFSPNSRRDWCKRLQLQQRGLARRAPRAGLGQLDV